MRQSKAVPQEEKPLRGELLIPEEVAQKLRMGMKSVYAMAANGEIPAHRIRCSLRFDSADVDDYIFFSKDYTGIRNLRLSDITVRDITERAYSQIDHTLNYIKKFAAQKKEVPMKK